MDNIKEAPISAAIPAAHRPAKPYAAIRRQITASKPSEAQMDAAYEDMKRRQQTAFEATDARRWEKPSYIDSRVISFHRLETA